MIKVYVGTKPFGQDIILIPGENLYTGSKPIINYFGNIDTVDEDMLNVSAGIYAADLCVKRQERELNIRKISIVIEVTHKRAWDRVKVNLRYALMVLSKDNWEVEFVQKTGKSSADLNCNSHSSGAVLLFSGGIDSMCAASEFARMNKEVILVSHNTQGNSVVDNCQQNIHKVLEDFYKTSIEHVHVKVFGRNKGEYTFPEERENSQRTRSFLFITLATLVMKKKKMNKILFMAENGQFAIHLPLNQSRVGPFSTHTADPEFLRRAQQIFSDLLENDQFEIYNPFLYKTKAEVFAVLPNELRRKAIQSASCWKISRTIKHCGECIPCISRRISIEYNELEFDEYAKDIFRSDISELKDEDTGKKNLVDYLEFISKFKTIDGSDINELLFEFPELINSAIDRDQAIALYNRIAIQSYAVFDKYPQIKKIL